MNIEEIINLNNEIEFQSDAKVGYRDMLLGAVDVLDKITNGGDLALAEEYMKNNREFYMLLRSLK